MSAAITYQTSVRCSVSPGIRDDYIVATVTDFDGNSHCLWVPHSWIERDAAGLAYLPVGIFEVDRERRRVVAELPSGLHGNAFRAWIPLSSFLQVSDRAEGGQAS